MLHSRDLLTSRWSFLPNITINFTNLDECSDEVPLNEKEDCCENKEDCKEDETCCQLETDTTHMEEKIAAL